MLLLEVVDELEYQAEVLGDLDDPSVGNEEFNSVLDIDQAQLSLISWLKTVYRELIKDQFVS